MDIRRQVTAAALASLLVGAPQIQPAQALECDLFKATYTPVDPEDDMSAEAGKQNRYSVQHIKKRLRFNQAQFAFRLTEANQKISYDFGFAFAMVTAARRLCLQAAAIAPAPTRCTNMIHHHKSCISMRT